MTQLVVTFKPKGFKDWSFFCRLLVVDDGRLKQGGRWSVIDGPFFPFSKDHPDQPTSGIWGYSGGLLVFGNDPDDRPSTEIYLILRSVHWDFRSLCTYKQLQGKGVRAQPATPDDTVIWVMGPAVQHAYNSEPHDYRRGPDIHDPSVDKYDVNHGFKPVEEFLQSL